MSYKLGIDVGGTKIEAILLDQTLQVIERNRVPSKRDEGYGAMLNRIVNLAKTTIGDRTLEGPIGICTPGAIDYQNGMLKNSNTLCLVGQPIKNDLEKEFGGELLIENDANCFALAEATLGAAKNYDVVFGVILGTGCGGGTILNKRIHRGPNNIAGEWGHHILYQDGRDCYCGRNGCTESYISGTALEKEWKELTGEFQRVTEILDNGDYELHPHWKNNFLNNFGLALANVVNILDPDVIVLGGGLSKIDFLYTEGKNAVYNSTFSENVITPIIKNKLGDSAGVFGAAILGDI